MSVFNKNLLGTGIGVPPTTTDAISPEWWNGLRYPPTYEKDPIVSYEEHLKGMREAFHRAVQAEKVAQQRQVAGVKAECARIENMLMELNLTLSNVAIAIATGDIEKVKACVSDLEKAQKPIHDYFRAKIENKMEPKKEEEADSAPILAAMKGYPKTTYSTDF